MDVTYRDKAESAHTYSQPQISTRFLAMVHFSTTHLYQVLFLHLDSLLFSHNEKKKSVGDSMRLDRSDIVMGQRNKNVETQAPLLRC